MFANLSAAILYCYCVKNNIELPLIIPLLIGFRSYISLQPESSLLRKIEILQEKTSSDIEYYSSIIISIIIIGYIYFNDIFKQYKVTLEYFFYFVVVLYIILLIINFIYFLNK